ncbi:hypothetical protein SBI67_21535 [Mycolicibacterium sp. 120266]|uniref:hypothetical protein n=1 Tax=Mycolicibacterium sp. 120266 TaxID=3090601 RepID=UPI00299E1DA6|nr:hypothetical protein [Mycolicibacterium sp. 120266]MDX1874711.1 hypothetical protein [Mycolicibacterium sp. 120266]
MDRAKRTMAAGAVALSMFLLAGGTSTAFAGAQPRDPGGHAGQGRDGHRGDRADRVGNGGTGRTHTATASRAPQTVPKPPAFGSSGSRSPAIVPVFVAPKVTFGNGRHPEPGRGVPPAVTAPQPGLPVPAPVAVVPQPAPLGMAPPAPHPAAPLDLSARHAWDSARPGQPWTSWFGLAGLLLIPLAGAALGYRQARAAKLAAGLVVR